MNLGEAVESIFPSIGKQQPHKGTKYALRRHPINEELKGYLREFRAQNQKDEIISRSGISDWLVEKYPHMGKVERKTLHRQITDILAEAGIQRIAKNGTTHQRYFWPVTEVP